MNESRASQRGDCNARAYRRGKSYEDARVFAKLILVSRIPKVSVAQAQCAKMIPGLTSHKINNCANGLEWQATT